MARATMSRWAMPPDRAYTEALAHRLSWNCSSSWSAVCRDALDERGAGGGDHAGGEDAARGGFAGAVRAEEAEDLSGLHVEVELVHRGEVRALVDLGQVLGVDDRVRRSEER